MSNSFAPVEAHRGPELLASHCASVARMQLRREPARRRLERRVGTRLARLLVFALAGDHAPRRDPRVRLGSSSP